MKKIVFIPGKWKKKILSSHQQTLVKFMYSSNLFALWQRPKTHKEYFSALKLFFYRSLHVFGFCWIELFFYSNPIFINRTILFQWKILLELFEFCVFILFLDIFFNLRNVVIYTCECQWELWGFFFYGQLKWKDIDRFVLFSVLLFYLSKLLCLISDQPYLNKIFIVWNTTFSWAA